MDINAFTITEVLRTFGATATPGELAKRVRQIDLGLSAEDEFMGIVSWLGRCSICHKLDNVGFRSPAYDDIVVPDLLVVFDVAGSQIPTAIEVKSSKKQVLSWKPEYYEGLLRYSSLTGIPVLLAWKHPSYSVWTLTDLHVFEKARKNFRLTTNNAFRENLLAPLAGDVAYQLMDGVGLRIEASKEELVEKDPSTADETWKLRITKAEFTDGAGNSHNHIPPGIWPLFLASDFSNSENHSASMIQFSFTYQSPSEAENNIQFLHRALPILVSFRFASGTRIEWRSFLQSGGLQYSGIDLRHALRSSFGVFTRYVFAQRPHTVPSFVTEEQIAQALS
jgi:Holliday junction resolvase